MNSGADLGDIIQPRTGFIYPKKGDEILCVVDYKTSAVIGCRTLAENKTAIIPANAKGKVIEIRKPGTLRRVHGYIGCVVFFEEIRKRYPCGIVLPWDRASDPLQFQFPSTCASGPDDLVTDPPCLP